MTANASAKNMQHLTLAQQIAQLEHPAPADFDPEDAYPGFSKDPDNDSDIHFDVRARREHYVDVGPSQLRRMRDTVADPKYLGVKTSRLQLQDFVPSPEPSPSSHSEVDHPLDEQPSLHHSPDPSQQEKSLASSLRETRAADKLKGQAVSRQLAIWDALVDARIRLQKSVTTANKLPHLDHIGPFVSSPTGRVATQAFLSEALQLSEDLFDLRYALRAQTEPNISPRKKPKIDTDEHDYNALFAESTAEMVAFDAQTHPDTLATLQKWSSKVQAVAPSALLPSSRTFFKSRGHMKSAAELVDEALHDQDKAVRRTWAKAARIDGDRGGINQTTVEDEGDEETFDDRDFYQSMLRDVIESKGEQNGINAADLYANSKKQKKKKLVDTKASKGRKLRYEPHEKLQHFMVPVPARGAWHDEQIDELFASILGKGFEEQDAPVSDAVPDVDVGQALQGFRVFG